jgi:RNA 2',3'-cyclic 3'-phosphodiesterase
MAKERPKSPRARLFVALDLPDAVRAGLGEWGAAALADPGLRPVPAENLHITPAFLGYRPEKEVERIAAVVEECAGAAPLAELLDPVPRPPRHPRLFALPATSPGAELLQAALQDRLAEQHFYKPENRPFWPHVTIARVRSDGRGSKRPQTVDRPPKFLPQELKTACFCRRLTLYRSETLPQGARYAPLAQVELPGGGQQ